MGNADYVATPKSLREQVTDVIRNSYDMPKGDLTEDQIVDKIFILFGVNPKTTPSIDEPTPEVN